MPGPRPPRPGHRTDAVTPDRHTPPDPLHRQAPAPARSRHQTPTRIAQGALHQAPNTPIAVTEDYRHASARLQHTVRLGERALQQSRVPLRRPIFFSCRSYGGPLPFRCIRRHVAPARPTRSEWGLPQEPARLSLPKPTYVPRATDRRFPRAQPEERRGP